MKDAAARAIAWLTLGLLVLAATGCRTLPAPMPTLPVPADAPRELAKQTLPSYRIEPPDILLIDAVYLPIPEGQTTPDRTQPPRQLYPQPVTGQFLVKPDGTVELGVYGSVQVAGQTIEEARESIQGFLCLKTGLKPASVAVAVDVFQMNSKFYYVITDGAGFGEGVYRFPIVGSETVLDAVSNIQGLHPVASRRHIWVARRGPGGQDCTEQILPVDWVGITQYGDIRTNHQILPGDRVYIMAQPIIRTNNFLQKFLAPVQQLWGNTLLGSETVNSIRGIR